MLLFTMKREFYQKLVQWKQKPDRLPLVVTGARQVGKTYILKEFGKLEFPKVHYFNFEEQSQLHAIFETDLNPQRILSELEFVLDDSIESNDLIIFDEVQACPKALNSLKYFSEKMPDYAICCAGSLLGLFLNSASFPVGRVEFAELFPLNFHEFLMACDDQKSLQILNAFDFTTPLPSVVHEHLWNRFKHYLIVGGLPAVVQAYIQNRNDLYECLETVRSLQKNLVLSYLADMAKHSGKENSMHIERLWKHIPEQLARDKDGAAQKFQFKNVIPGIRSYNRMVGVIDWLEKAGLIIKTKIIKEAAIPFTAYSKENSFKIYFFDVGLLGALSDLPVKSILDYDFGSYKGYLAENFVAQELRTTGQRELFCWRGRSSEIEFLQVLGQKIVPIEVKSGWVTKSKSLKVFQEKYSSKLSVILSGKNFKVNDETKTIYSPIYMCLPTLKHNQNI